MARPAGQEDPRLRRLVEICKALPEAIREDSGRHATFRIRKRTFAYFLDDHPGDEGIVGVVFKPPGGENESLIASDPGRFYMPAYIGHRGWVGLRLDSAQVDWDAWSPTSSPRAISRWPRSGSPPRSRASRSGSDVSRAGPRRAVGGCGAKRPVYGRFAPIPRLGGIMRPVR
jgi:hypothetical protein